MRKDTLHGADRFLSRNRRRQTWKKVVSILACIVVFCTTYALILPALTMEENTYCGLEPHQHSQECYGRILICGQEQNETTTHTHTEDCVVTERKLICENEDAQHQHTDECYETIETYTCGMEEGKSAGHVHTDECYELSLVCRKEEHVHKLGCYSNPEADVESPDIWLRSISKAELTGNWRNDVIAIAESQLGYMESSQNYVVTNNGESKKGYTRYGAWYGDPYGDWCAMFVSFCLNYADVPIELFPQESDCALWVNYLQSENYNFYVAASSKYEPLVGDLVFFDRDGDGTSDHVGLVGKRIEDGQGTLTKLKTIEGDVGDRVKYAAYSANDETILGYAVLPDNPNESRNDLVTRTFAGEDYSVAVTYGSDAQIPENAELTADEYAKDSEHYKQRYAEAAELYGWESDRSDSIRLFNIGFYVGNQEIEPASEVEITITYANKKKSVNYEIIHFGDEPETISAKSTCEDGEQNIDFTLDHMSDFMVIAAEETDPTTPGIVEGISPNGTVINLFDYWLAADQVGEDGTITQEGRFAADTAVQVPKDVNGGINQGHVLKFTDGGGNNGTTNEWTGKGQLPRNGLVANNLGADGYPFLTEYAVNHTTDYTGGPESLAYLFDPTIADSEVQFRKTFRNVGGLLKNKDGYYYYNSKENYAEFNEETNQFTLYKDWGVLDHDNNSALHGQFFPFNKFSEVRRVMSTDPKMNHYFGLAMTSRFVQRYDGHTNASRKTATTFEFSGDDDVWVFIDGVLIGDLGGIHDAASLSIDFATGKVVISVTQYPDTKIEKTLKELFETAGVTVEEGDLWRKFTGENDQEYWTFANNTYHTLKFYYMERGNYASNMMLKYNLTAVPATSIYKTDQYGRRLTGVEFSVYKATDSTYAYDPTKPVYTDTTDANGSLTFVDDDNMPYTLKELKEIFGEYCVLKETKPPEGFRIVGSDVHLHITDTALWCENTYESGVWAMVTLQVAAPTTLKLVDDNEQNFYEFDSGTQSNGTLFAVVVKRVKPDGEIADQDSWAPVSGTSTDGYIVYPLQGATAEARRTYFKQKAIDIAKEKGTVFEMAPSGAMELSMKDLPGKINQYYYVLPDADKPNAEYTIAYYWTAANSIDEATVDNTTRVDSDAIAPNSFDRTFGATIEVPNLSNRLIVQKFDDEGNLTNGAIFALFKANEDGTYVADDKTSVASDIIATGQYTTEVTFDSTNDTINQAVIKLTDGRTITSVEQRRTNSDVLEGADGTCVFGIWQKPLLEGCYYLLEVQAPPGFKINSNPVMVRVTDQAIYANAGIEGDGIQVARGPGYIASTLHKAASNGDVDNTLTWIYQLLRVSEKSTSFAEAIPPSTEAEAWDYAKDADGKILASYLRYTRTPQQLGVGRFLANYTVDPDDNRSAMDGYVRTGKQQIPTEVGWSYNEIYQDYDYGLQMVNATDMDTNYEDISGDDISRLFSRSVYVQVTNERQATDLEISKTVVDNSNDPIDNNQDFTFTVTVDGAKGEYDYYIYDVSNPTLHVVERKFSSGAKITLKNNQVAVIKNLPGGLNYTVCEAPVNSYNPTYSIDGGDTQAGFEASGMLDCSHFDEKNNRYVSKVDFTNTLNGTVNLTLTKKAMGNENLTLSGAQFVLSTTVGDVTYYYNTDLGLVELSEGQTPEDFAITTNENGEFVFRNIPNGKYVLREIAAPEEYMRLKADINITVAYGLITEVTVDADPKYVALNEDQLGFTVFNIAGHELPATGGNGTTRYTAGGALLIACVGISLLYIYQKRRKEASASS